LARKLRIYKKGKVITNYSFETGLRSGSPQNTSSVFPFYNQRVAENPSVGEVWNYIKCRKKFMSGTKAPIVPRLPAFNHLSDFSTAFTRLSRFLKISFF
jgi:hypothetical protein